MRKLPVNIATCILFLLALPAAAEVYSYSLNFDEPELIESADGVLVLMDGAPSLGHPGDPLLPKAPFQILLPPGERVVRIETISVETLVLRSGLVPAVSQPPYIIGSAAPIIRISGRPESFQSEQDWPADPVVSWREDLFRGHRILNIVLSPTRYQGLTGRLSWHPQLVLRVFTEFDEQSMEDALSMLRSDEVTQARVASLVDNPEALEAYASWERVDTGSRDFDDLDYLIVSTEAWVSQLDAYQQFLQSRGFRTGLFTKSWILGEYNGRDEQESIRNFVKAAYQESGAEYLLLVGDARDENGIPHRGFYCQSYSTTDYDLPGDIYFGALDGDWNNDGDGRWGEPGEDDLYPELAVGRACVSDAEDLANFIRKQKLYQEAPVIDQTERVLMVGELLWSNPLTWGADYKNEIWYGSDANGLVTAGVPASMAVGGLYERDWTWQKEHLLAIMNDGVGIVNHQGHAYYNLAAKVSSSDLATLENDGLESAYGFFYSQGCYCGSFDDKASYGGYHSDCFAERLTNEFGGAAATVMNSRYGWGDAGGTAGPSQFYDREFFDALFGERILEAGKANDDSKMDLAWMVEYPGMRWCLYDLNLFGDPAMQIWTSTPKRLQVSELSGMAENSEELSLRVLSNNAPVKNAQVTLYSKEHDLLLSTLTMISGLAVLQTAPLEPGVYHLTVRRNGMVPWRGEYRIKGNGDSSDQPSDGDEDGAGGEPLASAPGRFALGPNLPNPFNPSTRISFQLPEAAQISLSIYDVEGRFVRKLLDDEYFAPGSHGVLWDGRDSRGHELGSGVYFSVLISGVETDTGKLLLIK